MQEGGSTGHSLGLRCIFGDGVDTDARHEQDFNEGYFVYSFFVSDAPVIPCNTAAPSLWYQFGDNLDARTLDGQYIEEVVKVWSSPQGAVSGVEHLDQYTFHEIHFALQRKLWVVFPLLPNVELSSPSSSVDLRLRHPHQGGEGGGMQQGIVFPKRLEHCSVYLKTKASEPCTRRALKEAHRAMSVLEQAASVEDASRVASTAICKTIFEELLVSTSPGRPLRQVPRMYVSMLKSLELMVVDSNVLLSIRVYSW